ncbi:MAG: B12-binding domain-containing radical SAM protein [Bacteriovoracaceae bacterium]|jgi:anaerobic magnesium-protoporphyrin IX monomethyl ester cyclase|nr:B12-binding domain-containing radical SAM protein [Bacteriovoracaceae bacterium]
MKVLFIYPNYQGYARVPLGLSIPMTVLMEAGHEVGLFDTTFILSSINTDNEAREAAGLVKPTDTSHFFTPHSPEEVDEMLRQKIRDFNPDLVGISILEDNYEYSDRLLKVLKELKPDLPVIAGGTTPTVAPDVLIKNPGIDYLIRGEGEWALRDFCEKFEKGESLEKVNNLVYLRDDGMVVSNPLGPFLNLDDLPPQNLDLWDDGHFVKAYDGGLYKTGFFEMSRGCMLKCTYCVNVTYQDIFEDSGRYFRVKSVEKAVEEIKLLKEKYGFERIFFCDDNFLSMPKIRFDAFVDVWQKEVGLPFWMNTTIEAIGSNRDRIERLKEVGCCGIGLGLETGSDWFRRNILHKRIKNDRIYKTVSILHDFGYRTTANIMIGFPGEYLYDIYQSIQFVKEIEAKSCDVTFVAPYYATPIFKVAKKMGLIDVWEDRPGFNGMAQHIGMRQGPQINIPTISKDKLNEIYLTFMDYVEGKIEVPAKYIQLDESEPMIESRKSVLKTFRDLFLNPAWLTKEGVEERYL